ncbi:MAG: hypothetical protein ACPH2J_08305 [Akkermansiaceae bacterium]
MSSVKMGSLSRADPFNLKHQHDNKKAKNNPNAREKVSSSVANVKRREPIVHDGSSSYLPNVYNKKGP